MGFVQTNVNYAAEYAQALAQAYPYLSYFGAIWASENSTRYRTGMGKTMYIPTVTVSGAVDVNRNSIDGNFTRRVLCRLPSTHHGQVQDCRICFVLGCPQRISEGALILGRRRQKR